MAENKASAQAEYERLKQENEELKKAVERANEEKEAANALLREHSEALDAKVTKQEEEIIRQLRNQRKVRLIIASGKNSNERYPVPLAVNGSEFLIERDKEVIVPEAVVNVLNLAVAQVCEIDNSNDAAHMVFRHAPRFCFQVLGYVDPETANV